MSQLVDIRAAKTHLSGLVEDEAAGREIVIAKAGRPIARPVPLAPARPRRVQGALNGQLTIPDDFDVPLPDDVLACFEQV